MSQLGAIFFFFFFSFFFFLFFSCFVLFFELYIIVAVIFTATQGFEFKFRTLYVTNFCRAESTSCCFFFFFHWAFNKKSIVLKLVKILRSVLIFFFFCFRKRPGFLVPLLENLDSCVEIRSCFGLDVSFFFQNVKNPALEYFVAFAVVWPNFFRFVSKVRHDSFQSYVIDI